MEIKNLPQMTLCLLIDGNPPERVLLGCKKTGFGAGKYTGFGGKIEAGESALNTAVREMQEESGVRIRPGDLQRVGELSFIFPHRPTWSQFVHLFLASRWLGEPLESDEMRPAWFSIHRIPYGLMWQDGAYWLPAILAGGYFEGRFVFWRDAETICEADIRVTYPTMP